MTLTDSIVDDPSATLMAAPALTAPPVTPAIPASEGKLDDAVRLLAATASGDAAAFEELYRLWSPTLMGIALRILHDRTDAEECLQDAFVRIWRKATDFEASRGVSFVWAFGILRGLCLDRIRYHSRQKRGGAAITLHSSSEILELSEAPQVLATDDLRQVQKMLASLEPPERECLQLAVLLEYSHTEIAARLNTPLGTVKHRLRRALTKLQTLFQQNDI